MKQLPYKNLQLVDLPGELWADIAAYDGLYEISNMGRVKSNCRWVDRPQGGYWTKARILMQNPSINKATGCISLCIALSYPGHGVRTHTVAALVLDAFSTPSATRNYTHHIDGNSEDNRASNLSYEDLHVKRKTEFDMGKREKIREFARNSPQSKAFTRMSKDKRIAAAKRGRESKNRPLQYEKRNRRPITIWMTGAPSVSVFPSVKAASDLLGISLHTFYNAMRRPHKCKRMRVVRGQLSLVEITASI